MIISVTEIFTSLKMSNILLSQKYIEDIVLDSIDDIAQNYTEWLEPIYLALDSNRYGDIHDMNPYVLRHAPISWAEKVHISSPLDIGFLLDNDVPLDVILILVQRSRSIGQHSSIENVAHILSLPPSILRDKIYYTMIDDDHERDLLENASHMGNRSVDKRLEIIKELFYEPIPSHNVEYVNPSTITSSNIYDVHPIYIVQIKSGNTIYGLDVTEVMATINGDISRRFINPWTGQALTRTGRIKVIDRWKLLVSKDYPLIPLSRENYLVGDYGIEQRDNSLKIIDVVNSNAWNSYPDAIAVVSSLNPTLILAAENVRRFIPEVDGYLDRMSTFPSLWGMMLSMYPRFENYVYSKR